MCNLLLNNGGNLALNMGGFLLLSNCDVIETTKPGGSLGWYYNGWPEEKKEKAQELIEEYTEVLEAVSAPEVNIFTEQKIVIAQNILKQINAVDILNSAEIQAAIKQAEYQYYAHLAFLREQEDEAALMLLLN
jgi:hypothetical protein